MVLTNCLKLRIKTAVLAIFAIDISSLFFHLGNLSVALLIKYDESFIEKEMSQAKSDYKSDHKQAKVDESEIEFLASCSLSVIIFAGVLITALYFLRIAAFILMRVYCDDYQRRKTCYKIRLATSVALVILVSSIIAINSILMKKSHGITSFINVPAIWFYGFILIYCVGLDFYFSFLYEKYFKKSINKAPAAQRRLRRLGLDSVQNPNSPPFNPTLKYLEKVFHGKSDGQENDSTDTSNNNSPQGSQNGNYLESVFSIRTNQEDDDQQMFYESRVTFGPTSGFQKKLSYEEVVHV
ncbi:UNKNOWN [Stylonychia lemnae]|uniref:Uncharacterized protein n=1 Tax=Stylonychia lemnae TaxID=5949 RepID=A0A078B1Y3_STYLE|nr:UNKNOWN [Stylonychia lemnae]|eukprot:CDW87348.1 UNKNOWN [Stylonychia lemnae]